MSRIYIILVLYILSGCMKKELPPEIKGDVQFYIKGTAGTEPLLLEAGKDDIFYSTNRENYGTGYRYTGTFASKTTAESLSFIIYDTTNTIFSAPLPLPLKFDTTILKALKFKAESAGTGNPIHYWDLGDGNTSALAEPEHIYASPGNYQVALVTSFSGTCHDTIVNTINTAALQCGGTFTTTTNPVSNSVEFQAQAFDTAGATYSWSFGDGTGGSGKDIIHQYNTMNTYLACLTITKGSCTQTYCRNVATGQTNCITNFSYSPVYSNTHQVEIRYTDKDGKTYRSNISAQPASSHFTITAMEPYELEGKAYRKLFFNATCRAYKENDPQQYKEIIIGSGVAAIE